MALTARAPANHPGDRDLILEKQLTNHRWNAVNLDPLTLSKLTALSFRVDRTWVPYLSNGTQDNRNLGIAVAVPNIRAGGAKSSNHQSSEDTP